MSVTDQAIAVANQKHASLARGWNTWDTRSVLHHVRLPDGLCIALGFAAPDRLVWLNEAFFGRKLMGRTPGTMLTSMDKTLPIEDHVEVRPGIRSYDGSYTELELNLRGARFRVETTAQAEDWHARVTPLQADPWLRVLTVRVSYLWNSPGHGERKNDQNLCACSPAGETWVWISGKSIDDPNLPVESPYVAVRLDQPIVLGTGARVDVREVAKRLERARARVEAQHRAYGGLAEAHEAMQTSLAWNLIYEPKYRRILCTVARDWNCKRGGYAVFCWDSFFTSWMIARDHPELGYACMLETFREMIDDAFVSNVVQGSGRRAMDRSQPPVAGICVLGMYRDHADREALAAAWPALLAWNRWWNQRRRNANGSLSLGSHPFEPQTGDPAEFVQPNTLAGAALEALDNAPIYDDAPFDPETHLMGIEDVGLNALYVADCRALAEIADTLGLADEVRELHERARHYEAKLQDLWCEGASSFMNRRLDTGDWVHRHAPTAFYPLLGGAAEFEQATKMVEAFLMNPEWYQGAWMIPSVPRHDPTFSEQLYWRGRIWPPMNFLVYLGLHRYRLDAARKELVAKSVAVLTRNWREQRTVPENFSAIDGSGGVGAHTHSLLTWGGLMGFMAMIEEGHLPAPFTPADGGN